MQSSIISFIEYFFPIPPIYPSFSTIHSVGDGPSRKVRILFDQGKTFAFPDIMLYLIGLCIILAGMLILCGAKKVREGLLMLIYHYRQLQQQPPAFQFKSASTEAAKANSGKESSPPPPPRVPSSSLLLQVLPNSQRVAMGVTREKARIRCRVRD